MDQVRQRVIASCHLGALTLPETIAYIRHRLEMSGWNGRPMFQKEVLFRLHDFTAGVPRRINMACDRLLLASFLSPSDAITLEAAEAVLAEMLGELGPLASSGQVAPTDPLLRRDAPRSKRRDRRRGAAAADCGAQGADRRPGLDAPGTGGGRRPADGQDGTSNSRGGQAHVDERDRFVGAAQAPRTPDLPRTTRRAARLVSPFRSSSVCPGQGSEMLQSMLTNAFTVDVEDYFQVSAFARYIDREAGGPALSHREQRQSPAAAAVRSPRHGHILHAGVDSPTVPHHGAPYRDRRSRIGKPRLLTPPQQRAHTREIEDEMVQTRELLEDIGGQRVIGYRAPSFSIGRRNLWMHDARARRPSLQLEHLSDHHDHYGMPDAPRFAYRTPCGLTEIPAATVELGSTHFPASGGGYFRLLPYAVSAWNLRRINLQTASRAVFFCHPWEIDPEQPKVSCGPQDALSPLPESVANRAADRPTSRGVQVGPDRPCVRRRHRGAAAMMPIATSLASEASPAQAPIEEVPRVGTSISWSQDLTGIDLDSDLAPHAQSACSTRRCRREQRLRSLDSICRCAPRGQHFHRWEWRGILAGTFGHVPHYLIASRAGEVSGVLPLARCAACSSAARWSACRSRWYGGVAADDRRRARLDEAATALADCLGVRRTAQYRWVGAARSDWPTQDLYVTLRRGIPADDEANMLAIPRKQRAMVRKGIANGLRSADRRGGRPLLRALRRQRPSPRHAGAARDATSHASREAFGADCEVLIVPQRRRRAAERRAELLLPRRGAAVLRRRHHRGARAGRQRLQVLGADAPRLRARRCACSTTAAASAAPAPSPSRRTGASSRRRCSTSTGCTKATPCRRTIRRIRNTGW